MGKRFISQNLLGNCLLLASCLVGDTHSRLEDGTSEIPWLSSEQNLSITSAAIKRQASAWQHYNLNDPLLILCVFPERLTKQ